MRDIKQLIRKIAKEHDKFMLAKVLSVDATKLVCDVEPLDESPTLFDVRIDMSQDDTTGLQVIPATDSVVVIGFLDEEEAYVAMTSDVDSVIYRKETTEVLMDKDKINLTKGNTAISLDGDSINMEKDTTKVAIESTGLVDVSKDGVSIKSLLTDLISLLELSVGNTGAPIIYQGNAAPAAFATLRTKIAQLLK